MNEAPTIAGLTKEVSRLRAAVILMGALCAACTVVALIAVQLALAIH